MARITAIVLAYNRPGYLQEALDSVSAQSLAPYEVIVMDDASPGGPLADQVDSRGLPVRFLRMRHNSGPAAAAATAVRAATGEYISFLNDDDLWAPTFVERLASALDRDPAAGLAFCDHGIVYPDGTTNDERADRLATQYGRARLAAGSLGSTQDFAKAALIDQTVPAHSFSMSRCDVLYPTVILAGGDVWDFFVPLSVVLAGCSGTYVPERLGLYRISPDGITASWSQPERRISSTSRRVAAYVLILRAPHLKDLHRASRRAAVRLLASSLRTALASRKPRIVLHWIDQTAHAVGRPGRRPARGR